MYPSLQALSPLDANVSSGNSGAQQEHITLSPQEVPQRHKTHFLPGQLLSLSVLPIPYHFQHVLFACACAEMELRSLSCWEQVGVIVISCYCKQKSFGLYYE